MKEKLPEKTSMPPQPALTPGSWRLTGLTFFCGNRVQMLPPE